MEKLHHYYGHVSVNKLEQLVRNSERLDEKTRRFITEVKEKCVSCKLNKNSIPKPTVSLLRATKFNQVVTLDLKEFKKRSEEKFRYILYIIECIPDLLQQRSSQIKDQRQWERKY